MTTKHKKSPLLGEAFNPEQMNMGEIFSAVAEELEYYLPDTSWNIQNTLDLATAAYSRAGTGAEFRHDKDRLQVGHEAITDAEDLLSEWARSVERHDYIYFEVSGPFAGFRINVESAL